MVHTYYDILGIDKDATANEIKQAYRKLALEHHPDKGGDEEQFKKVQEAYQCLADDGKRDQYDFKLSHPQNNEINLRGGGGIPSDIMEFFKSHVEETIWSSLGRSAPQEIPAIEICLPITLIDVCCGGEKKVDFERLAFVNMAGNIIEPRLATQVCITCRGSGNKVNVVSNGFFIQQTISPCTCCSGEGYVIINGCKLVKRKCRFRHNLQIGILNKEQFIFEHDGNVVYNKATKQFYQGHVVINIAYDITETNKILYNIYEFPDIIITKVEFGDIYYEYNASVFEFMTGTQFNLPLPNNRFMLIMLNSLDQKKVIKNYGLPQIYNKEVGAFELRNIIISFKMKSLNKKIYITDDNKALLRRIFSTEYPQTIDGQDAIIINYAA